MSEPQAPYFRDEPGREDTEYNEAGHRWDWYVERFRDVLSEGFPNPSVSEDEIRAWFDNGVHPEVAAGRHRNGRSPGKRDDAVDNK
ncbi:hypothetical protein BSZ35_02440 [Salinibacter sp. 10B]|uniref:hypothetical protein n=1 Tax=Salinibacter sp. 10B TaxID=1923971 RepID=UPI000CF3D40D|nr:hypothetical protein [Salinibacter sp. 10B]PQJ33608.1 hypothetical protein BSZ35_02440 [Salinibacter sp. 10B]